jgi:hypothetical protein
MSPTFFALVVVLLLVPATLRAQETFTPLQSGLKVGQKISVMVDVPCPTAECGEELVKGRIAKLDETSIAIHDGRASRQLHSVDVRRIERPKDRVWNGVGYGFAVGFSAGFIAVISDGCNPGEWCILHGPSVATGLGLLAGGVGAGIGALTDAAISKRRVIFDRSRSSAMSASISPIVGRGQGGVRVSLSF